ncbi:hypothetical protein IWQ62_000786 [Dispira parvispora]|uniref:CobW/HypB/UreG nucleotide-binding domain-containing protein n=1 Tax=Dispira parvispora TaxID=1520584 RepID=A0A9W8AZG3_9FUNG|nr:hypothetical protein IWQ62_000786 [Dispira parvispora]
MSQDTTAIDQTTSEVTVFTGFLGAGKTTLILSLLKQLPRDYRVVVLKNEFGNAETDSALLRESSIEVQEMVNGCLCCVLVGQMKNALMELKEKYRPQRIIIETSGSAFPAPIAWQIREMANDGFHLDSIMTVVDCVNFTGYEDTSYTAKMQAQYTDLILLNKHHLVTERELDTVIDHVNELNTDTAKVKCGSDTDAPISADLIFGLDTQLFKLEHRCGDSCQCANHSAHQPNTNHHLEEVDRIEISKDLDQPGSSAGYDISKLNKFLTELPKDDIYRIKGVIRLDPRTSEQPDDHSSLSIINFAFGRYSLTPVGNNQTDEGHQNTMVRVTVMGQDLRLYLSRLQMGFDATAEQCAYFPRATL